MKKAFTIIELAIVTVIIAILIGAVVAGTDVLDAANRSTLIKEINGYTSAVANFRLKYEQLPGDMDNAASYWPSATNGDGNTYINGGLTENIYAWNHLNEAEYLDKYYDGTSADYEKSVPESSAGKIYFNLATAGASGGGNIWRMSTSPIFEQVGLYLGLGAATSYSTYKAASGFVNAKNAQSIDFKIDDGKASAGVFMAVKGLLETADGYMSGCVDGADAIELTGNYGSIDYDIDDDTESCRILYFIKGLD